MKLLVFLLSLCVTSLEAATITNWGAQLPTAVPASGDVILMQKGGVTYYFTPNQLAEQLSTNPTLRTTAPLSALIFNSNGTLSGSSILTFTNGNLGVGATNPTDRVMVTPGTDTNASTYPNIGIGIEASPISGYAYVTLYNPQTNAQNFGIYNGFPNTTNFTIRQNGVRNLLIGEAGTGFIGLGLVSGSPTNTLDVSGHASIRSNLFILGTTNHVSFGATNPAPVSAVAPTKWISVRVAGESGLYRIPLYE